MSAPSESATSPSPCACTNISLMQLFHELKQKFPGVPDHVVSNTIELYCHDKQACETHLHSEVKASLTHAYHASSSAAARQLNELKVNAPLKCRNQPIVKHEAPKSTALKSITCQEPQTAILSTSTDIDENYEYKVITDENDKNKVNTDANQNVVEPKKNGNINEITSPVINIDNCYPKYSESSDVESTNENVKEQEKENESKVNLEQPESTNYRILKSNKIKCNLHQRLEKAKEKKTIKKEDSPKQQEKPKRPNTLDFIKPDIAFKETLKQPEVNTCQSISPTSTQKHESQPLKETTPGGSRQERSYPLNVSVNVNCHMDLSRPYGDCWLEDYDSPRAITSVNLTVCTPTSNMASPVREARGEEGFEGHVTVTVSPSTTRSPRRPAPPPPSQPSRLESPRPTRTAPEPPERTPHERSLIERQKERLGHLARALAQEKGRLAQLTKETQILAAPLPSQVTAQRLREYVERMREKCNTLAKRLERGGSDPEESNFYNNIYTGQRAPPSWRCHMCTFQNHPLLDKCEECDMPRIFVGTSPVFRQDSGFGSLNDRNNRNGTQVSNIADIRENCKLPLFQI